MSDPRTGWKRFRISEGETISGRNSVSSATISGTTVTVTTATAHGYAVGQKVTISGAVETEYNGTFTILTVPSTTTFTYTVPKAPSGNATGTVKADQPQDVQGLMLAAVELPASMTGTALTFQGSLDGDGDMKVLRESDNSGAALSWAIGANGTIIFPSSTEVLIAGLVQLQIVSGSAEAEARELKGHFVKTNQ